MQRQLNYKFTALLLLSTAVLAGVVHLVHGFQATRTAEILLTQGERAQAEKKYPAAANYLGRYLSFVPKDTVAREKLGLVLYEQAKQTRSGRLAERAFFVLEQVLRSDPERSQARRHQVELASALKNYSAAKSHLLFLLGSGEDAELEQRLGKCEVNLGKTGDAIKWFKKAKRHAPQDLANYELLALLQPEDAQNVLAEMVKTNPKSFKAWLLRAQHSLDQAKDQPNALAKPAEYIAEAAKLAPDDVAVLLAQVKLARRKANQEQARLLLVRAVELHPNSITFYLEAIALEQHEEQWQKAEEHLRRGLKVFPQNADLLSLAADLSLQRGDLPGAKKAVAELTAIVSKDKSELDKEHLQAVVAFQQARIEAAEGKWAAARTLLEKLQNNPSSATFALPMSLLLGECYARLGNPDQALLAFQKYVQGDPLSKLSIRARRGMAAAYLSMGRHDKAAVEYRQLLDLPRAPAIARLELARLLTLNNLRSPRNKRDWKAVRAELDRLTQEVSDGPDRAQLIDECTILRADSFLLENPETQRGKAQSILEEACRKRPEQSAFWVALARLAAQQNTDDGLKILDKAERQPKLIAPGQVILARIALVPQLTEKKAKAALHEIEKKASEAPADERLNLLWGLANAYFRVGAGADAYRLLQDVAKQQPNNLDVKLVLFDLAGRDKKESEQRGLRDAIKTIEGSAGVFWRQADAILLVDEVRRKLEDSTPAAEVAGLLVRARKRLNEVSLRRPTWYRVPALEAEIDELENRPERAIEKYQAAMRLGDRRPEIVRSLVKLLWERRRFNEADTAVSSLLDREDLLLNSGLGKVAAETLLRAQNPERTLEFAQKSVSSASTNYQDHLWLGHILNKLERFSEAEKELVRARELNSQAAEVWLAHISMLAARKQLDKAKEVLAEAAKHLRGHGTVLALAEAYETVGDLDKAGEYFLRAAKTQPDPDVRRKVAAFYLRANKLAEAQPLLREIIAGPAAGPALEHVVWARRMLAAILASKGDYASLKEALKLVDANIRPGEAGVEDLRVKAGLLATHPGHRKDAIELFDKVNRQQPLTGTDLFMLAQLYDNDHNWLKAQSTFLGLLGSTDGSQPGYIVHYARRLIDRKDVAQAEVWLKRLEQQAAGALATKEIKARVLHARGRHADAVALLRGTTQQVSGAALRSIAALLEDLAEGPAAGKYLEAAEEIYRRLPDSPENTLALGRFLVRRNRLAEGLPILEKLVEKGMPELIAQGTLPVLASETAGASDFERIERWLRQAREKNPNSTLLTLAFGHLRDRQGRYQEAAAIYRDILDKEPHNSLALNDLAWLTAYHQKDYAKALTLIDLAIDARGPSANLLDTRGVIGLLKGDVKRATKDLESAIALVGSKTSVVLSYHLAQAHFQADNRTAARVALKKAIDGGLTARSLHALERVHYQQLQDALTLKKLPVNR